MSRNRDAKVEMRIRNERQTRKTLRLALVFPGEVPPAEAEMEVGLPAGSEWSRLTWLCHPVKRGRYRIQSSCVEGSSPFGLWAVRRTVPTPSEIRVYPNLMTERKNLAALFLNRGSYGIHAGGRWARAGTSRSCASISPATAMTTSTGRRPPNADGPSRRFSRSNGRRRCM